MDLDIILNLLRESNLNNAEALVARLGGVGLTIAVVRSIRLADIIPEALSGGWKSALWALGLSAVVVAAVNLARTAVDDPAVWWRIMPLEVLLTWVGAMGAWSGAKALGAATKKVVSAIA